MARPSCIIGLIAAAVLASVVDWAVAAKAASGTDGKKADDAEAAKKMRVCFELAGGRAHHRANSIQKVLDAVSELGTEDMTHEEALETVMLGWMTQCYESIDSIGTDMIQAASSENETLYLELEEKLLGPLPSFKDPNDGKKVFMEAMAFIMTQPKKLLKLAKKIMREPLKKDGDGNLTANASSAASPSLGSKITPATIALTGFALAFGAAVLGVWRLARSEPEEKKGKPLKGSKAKKAKVG